MKMKMTKTSTFIQPPRLDGSSRQHRSFLRCFSPAFLLLLAAFFIVTAFLVTHYYKPMVFRCKFLQDSLQLTTSKTCQAECRPNGSETLPKGIVSMTSDLEMRPLWGSRGKKSKSSSMSLLAMAVGIKQKESVNNIVKKFPATDFAVILFHYDGIVDQWKDLEWSNQAVHVSAINQTKWWFAKRFLHPDIIAEYAYIFLWDEDIGVENFNAKRYVSIIREEGLEISQPALDPKKSELHHHLTARDSSSRVHRRVYKKIGPKWCNENSTDPPCTGFVEMMAPVFSGASWRCAWYMIQNDLVYGWGVDFQLGYCAQGDRTKNIGIVDSEYIVHYGLPTLGGSAANKESPSSNQPNGREVVKKWSFQELEIFKGRWRKAVENDECWIDPYQQPPKLTKH